MAHVTNYPNTPAPITLLISNKPNLNGMIDEPLSDQELDDLESLNEVNRVLIELDRNPIPPRRRVVDCEQHLDQIGIHEGS